MCCREARPLLKFISKVNRLRSNDLNTIVKHILIVVSLYAVAHVMVSCATCGGYGELKSLNDIRPITSLSSQLKEKILERTDSLLVHEGFSLDELNSIISETDYLFVVDYSPKKIAVAGGGARVVLRKENLKVVMWFRFQ